MRHRRLGTAAVLTLTLLAGAVPVAADGTAATVPLNQNLLVNGTGIAGHVSPVHWLENTLYAAAVGGFMRIDFLRNGRARLGVFTVDADRIATESYSAYLRQEQ